MSPSSTLPAAAAPRAEATAAATYDGLNARRSATRRMSDVTACRPPNENLGAAAAPGPPTGARGDSVGSSPGKGRASADALPLAACRGATASPAARRGATAPEAALRGVAASPAGRRGATAAPVAALRGVAASSDACLGATASPVERGLALSAVAAARRTGAAALRGVQSAGREGGTAARPVSELLPDTGRAMSPATTDAIGSTRPCRLSASDRPASYSARMSAAANVGRMVSSRDENDKFSASTRSAARDRWWRCEAERELGTCSLRAARVTARARTHAAPARGHGDAKLPRARLDVAELGAHNGVIVPHPLRPLPHELPRFRVRGREGHGHRWAAVDPGGRRGATRDAGTAPARASVAQQPPTRRTRHAPHAPRAACATHTRTTHAHARTTHARATHARTAAAPAAAVRTRTRRPRVVPHAARDCAAARAGSRRGCPRAETGSFLR